MTLPTALPVRASRAGGSPTPARILFLIYSSVVGGMETLCLQISEECVRRGARVCVVLPEATDFDAIAGRFQAAGADIERFNFDREQGRLAHIPRFFRLLRIYRRWRPQLVHIHTADARGGAEAVIAARFFTRATVVITEHELPFPQPQALHRIGNRLIKDRLSHALVAVSRRNAALRNERIGIPRRKSFVVLNGVELTGVSDEERRCNRAAIRREMAIGDDEVVLGCVVRLWENKGLPDLLRAFAIARATTACKLLLVGDGPLREELTALASELGVGGDVRFAGHRDRPAPFIDAMDAFVLAVPAGSMSIALLEAMERGVPPVITFGGPEEAVIPGETGLCAPPSNPEKLAEALTLLLSDPPLRRRLGDAAAAHVRRHYSIARIVDDYLAVYSGARSRTVPVRLKADGPPTTRPGDADDRCA